MNANKIFILAAVCLSLAACGGVDPNSPLGKRQAIFKEMLRTSEDLGGMLRGRLSFNEQRFAEGAAKLDELSRQPWQHFPQVRESDGDSQARDEVWQRQERFQQLARELEAATAELRGAAQVKPLQARALEVPVAKVEAGGLTLDLLTRRVSVDGRAVELSTREFALAEVLVRHAGQVLSKTQLLDQVWGYDFEGGSNVVEVYVRHLRRKLGAQRIETVRGAGYRLVP